MLQTLRDALLAVLFGPVGRLLPFSACRPLGRAIASVTWRLGVRRDITLRNLELAMPELSRDERERIGRASMASLLTVFLEILTLRHLSPRAIDRWLSVENIELLGTIGEEGALLLSAHVGNWELLSIGVAQLTGLPFSVVVKEQRDGRQLERTRRSRGSGVIPTGRAAREVSAALRNGGVVAILADQSAPEGEHLVPMFGIPTYTYSAPARLALRFRPRVMVVLAVRDSSGRYRARIEELHHHDLPDTPEGALLLSARYVAVIEQTVRSNPEQWVWQHRKWKNTPGIRYD